MNQVTPLPPDLIGYIKLLAQKRDALIIGKQESDDKKYALTVYESLAEFPTADEKTMFLVRKGSGEILVKKTLLEKSEIYVFFWLIFANIRRHYTSSEDTDAAAWKYVLDNYKSGKRTDFSKFYEEFNETLLSFLNGENEGTKFEEYVMRRAMRMYEMCMDKVMEID